MRSSRVRLQETDASDPTSYDVSVKVGDTIYVVLYTQPLGELPPKYASRARDSWCWSEKTQLPTTTCWAGRFRCP